MLCIVICYSLRCIILFVLIVRRPPRSTRADTRFPFQALFRSAAAAALCAPPGDRLRRVRVPRGPPGAGGGDRGRGRRAAEEEARLRLPGRPGAPGLRR